MPEIIASLQGAIACNPTGETLQGKVPETQMLAKIHVFEKGSSETVAFEDGDFDESARVGQAEGEGYLLRGSYVHPQRGECLKE